MVRLYDRLMSNSRQRRYYGNSDFYNFGYWGAGATTQREASEALVDTLLDRLPDRKGNILDIACGLGASTRRLFGSYPPENVTAINISEAQVARARQNAPGATVLRMDAAKLHLPDSSFDAVLCVEAAFHFDTRDAFLREAFRVLKPGGALVLSDILFHGFTAPIAGSLGVPKANLVADIETYSARLRSAGFEQVSVENATDACLGGFRRSLVAWPAAERRAGRLKAKDAVGAAIVCRAISGWFGATMKAYLLVSAKKPDHD
jgi:ubiquinone/menaquinone biosynthesis C-methylase UbiE